jgi:hypothetical protein
MVGLRSLKPPTKVRFLLPQPAILGIRPMAGQRSLKPRMGVRLPHPQPYRRLEQSGSSPGSMQASLTPARIPWRSHVQIVHLQPEKVMSKPKEVGERTEAAILNHFIQKGVPVSIPWGNNQRYDLVLEENGVLLKAQCKTGTYKKGVVTFATSSKSGGKSRKDYSGQIDCFLVYCEQLNTYYKIDIVAISNKNAMSLRVDPLKKFGPKSTIKWAKDYEV